MHVEEITIDQILDRAFETVGSDDPIEKTEFSNCMKVLDWYTYDEHQYGSLDMLIAD